jgi:drug/metabolite transporter (DMT)-like permease
MLWGGTFFFIALATDELPPLTIVACRVALAAVALHVLLAATGQHVPTAPRVLGAFLVMGLINNAVPFALIAWGQTRIAGGLASILNATTPLFAVVLAHVLTPDERLSASRGAGVLLGFLGVVVMIGTAGSGGDRLAEAAVLCAALSYALAGLYGRTFARMGIAPQATATGQVTASSLILAPLALLVDRPWTLPAPSLAATLAILALGLASTALAYVIYFRLLATAGATNLLLVTFLIPVSAILLGALVLGETLALRHYVGMALIGAGLAAIDGRTAGLIARRFPRAVRGRPADQSVEAVVVHPSPLDAAIVEHGEARPDHRGRAGEVDL